MSCNNYRTLIQTRFDDDLDQDEINSVDDHIDACESCAKFEHQLDQMIQGAEEMPLPEELTPPNPEALAKMVQDKLPQQKSSVFSMFSNMFGGATGGNSKGNKQRGEKKTEFPKRSSAASRAGGGGGSVEKQRTRTAEESADDGAMSNRLKSLAREPEESRDVQSTTKGLGEKFGFGSNALSAQDAATPLTLAESIRRKISESQKLSVDEDDGGGSVATEDRLLPPAASGGQDNWNAPIKMPGQQAQPDPGWTPQGGPPANSWAGTGAQQQQQQQAAGGSDIGLAPASGPGSDGWADKRAPKGTSPGDDESGWGPPPAGGAWEDPSGGAAAAAAQQNQNWQGSQPAQSGSWATPAGGAPPAAAQGGDSWGAGAQASWATSPSPTQPTSDQFGSGGWNVPSAKANQTSAPVSEAPPPANNANWGGAPGAGAVSSWGGAPAGQQAAEPAKTGGGWSEGGNTSSGSWDATKADEPPPAAAAASWGQPAANAASGDSWGGSTGAPAQPAAGWGNQPAAAAAPAPAPQAQSTSDDSWGKPAGAAAPAAAAGGWGTPATGGGNQWGGATPAAPAPPADPQATSNPNWGSPPAQAAPAAGGWGTPAPAQAQAQAAPQADWAGGGGGEPSGGWGAGAAPQAKAGDANWGAKEKGGWDSQPWEEPKKLEKDRGNWSIEAEQMETGTWSNYGAQANAALTAGGASPASQVASEMSQDRFDKPIQERVPEPPPQQVAQAQAAPADSHWDVPISEKLKAKTDQNIAPPATPNWGAQAQPAQADNSGWGGAPAAPAPAPAAPQAAAQTGGESHWDLPIQEKMKAQQAAAAAAAPAPQFGQATDPVQPFSQAPAFGAPPDTGFGGQAQAAPPAGFGQPSGFGAPAGAPPSFGAPAGAPPSFGAAPGAPPPAFGAPQEAPPNQFGGAPAPAFGAPPAAAQPPAAPATPGWGALPAAAAPAAPAAPPAQPTASQNAGLFGKQLDDSAMDQIFDGLGIKETSVQANQAAAAAAQPPAMQPPPAPVMPAPPAMPAPPQMPAASGWGTPAPMPPAMTPPGGAMSFAPEVPAGEAPRFTAIPPKPPETQPQMQAPPPPPAMPAPPAMTPPPAPTVSPAAKRGNGMFQLDDDAVDQIFAKIGVEESSIPVNQQSAPAPVAAAPMPQPPAPPPAMPQPPAMSAPPGMGGMGGMPGMAPPMGAAPPAPAGSPPGFGMAPPSGFGAPPMGAPAPAMPAPPAPPAPPQPATPQAKGLFQVDDSDMDNLFDKVLMNPGAEPKPAAPPAMPAPMPQAPMPPPQMAPQAPPMGFGNAPGNGQYPGMPQGAAPPPQAPAPAMPEPPQAMAHVPAQSSMPPPKIEGIGKLDASADVAETGSGRIAAIGKFLLDQKDLEKLSKITAADQQDIKMRILTLEASEDLQTLLSEIGGQEKVIGSVIVGHDGLLIANTMPEEVDAESIGVWALGVYMNTEHVTKKMGHERVHQVVSRTPRGYVVIADFGGGLLVTITEGTDTDTLIPLMRKITDLVS